MLHFIEISLAKRLHWPTLEQGDRIGRIFAHSTIVYFGQFFKVPKHCQRDLDVL
jgi:hypothetical protein